MSTRNYTSLENFFAQFPKLEDWCLQNYVENKDDHHYHQYHHNYHQVMLTTRNIFIANLAVSDIFLCAFTMPLTLVDLVTKFWTLGEDQVLIAESFLSRSNLYGLLCSSVRVPEIPGKIPKMSTPMCKSSARACSLSSHPHSRPYVIVRCAPVASSQHLFRFSIDEQVSLNILYLQNSWRISVILYVQKI